MGMTETSGGPGQQATTLAAGDGSMHASGRGRWIGLAMLSLGVAMIIVDATIVNVAVPTIVKDLRLDGTTAEWINTTYALVFAALLVTMGRIGDLVGRRFMYLLGLVIFMFASILAGFAPTGELLIAARILQGVGGAAILPATQSILNSNFRGRDRAVAFGIWGAVIGGVAALGPLIGGWLTTNLSWRWAFYVNVPIGIIALIGTLAYISESKDEHARPGFDLPGFILITLGLGGVVFGLIEGRQYGWIKPDAPFSILGWTWPMTAPISIIPVAIGGGLLALVVFYFVETRREREGRFFLFDFELWRYPAFRFGNLAGSIVSLGEFGLLFVLPLFLQAVLGLSAFDTGLVFLSLAVGSFFAAPGAASFARRYGPRRVVTLGMGLEAVGILATTLLISRTVTGFQLAIPLFVYGLGVGFATAQLTSVVLSDIPPQRSGLASGTNSTMRQVGSALGIAILGTVLFVSLINGAKDRYQSIPAPTIPGAPAAANAGLAALPDFIINGLNESAGQALTPLRTNPAQIADFVPNLPPQAAQFLKSPAARPILAPYVEAAEEAFVQAARLTGFVATGFVLLGLVFSFLLPETRPRRVDDETPREEMEIALGEIASEPVIL
jgi:EmrB/QacA subfamily drug resistance transporter